MNRFSFFESLWIFACVLTTNTFYAQFNASGVAGPQYGRTNNGLTQIYAIGIGPFVTPPLSALHINTSIMPSTPYGAGETFRTSSNATGTNANAWRMFVGAGNGLDYFSLYNPAATTDIYLRTSQGTGSMFFNMGGGTLANCPDNKFHIMPDDQDQIYAFENTATGGFTPTYNAKFIINDRK